MITDHYSLVEVVLGTSFVLWGVAVLINREIFSSLIEFFLSEEPNNIAVSYMAVFAFLVLGIVMISTHNDWHLGLSLITTVIGWAATIQSFLWLAFRKPLKPIVQKLKPPFMNKGWLQVTYSLLAIAVGVAILWNQYSFSM